jgi:hypothetical protein
LIYRNTPYAGVPEDVNDLIPILTNACNSEASGTGFHAHRAGAGVASFTAVRASGAGCAEVPVTKANIKHQH